MEPIALDLINNVTLLFALALLYQVSNFRVLGEGIIKKIFIGLLIGGFCLLIMMNTYTIDTGLFYDTRSVLISVTGAFFGPTVTIIASVIAFLYRIYIGGDGVYAGSLTIVFSAMIGLLWHKIRKIFPKFPIFIEYFIFGLIVHIIVVGLQFLTPNPLSQISKIWLPFLVIFPIASSVLGLALKYQENRLSAEEAMKNQKILLQSSIDSPKAMEIYTLDLSQKYLTFNKFHANSMKLYYGIDIKEEMSFLDCIPDPVFKNRLYSEISLAQQGKEHIVESEIEIAKGKFYETLYTPLYDVKKHIIGVSVFAHDITDRKISDKAIQYLSYHDPLTGLYNRLFYQEELAKIEKEKDPHFTFVMFDINGLKIMNDAFGHQIGDVLLQKTADIVKNNIPPEYPLMRIGGDEFVIIMRNVDYQKALKLVDKCKSILEKEVINGMNISISFGVEEKDSETSLSDVIKNAESKMYRNKLFEVSSSRNETIRTILNTLHVKNKREEAHSKRVSFLCAEIGSLMKLRREEINLLKLMGNLHDIGKIAIDDAILNKPDKLNADEWEEIKRHPEIGYRILLTSPDYAEIAEDILAHHERWDGLGYPRKLQGKNIPLRARIIAIADAYDAMTSIRPYRKPLSKEEALNEIIKGLGTQFDPELANKFVEKFKTQEL